MSVHFSVIFLRKFNSEILKHQFLSNTFWWQAFLSSESMTGPGRLTICLCVTGAWLSMTYSADIVGRNMSRSSSLSLWQCVWHSEEIVHICVYFTMEFLNCILIQAAKGILASFPIQWIHIHAVQRGVTSLHSSAADLTHFHTSFLIFIITVAVIGQLLINTKPPPWTNRILPYGSGHEGTAVLLLGFAINW